MKVKLLIVIMISFFLASMTFAQVESKTKKDSSKIEKFDPKRDADKDIKDAIKLAKKTNKKILLDVGGEWCPWCKKLDKCFHENKDISGILEKSYIVIKVNYSPENKNEKTLSKYPKINGYPHLFVLDKTGKMIHSQDTGELETGDHHDPEKVITFLKEWSDK